MNMLQTQLKQTATNPSSIMDIRSAEETAATVPDWKAEIHQFDFHDFLHAGINLDADRNSEPKDKSETETDSQWVSNGKSTAEGVENRREKGTFAGNVFFSQSIYEYCETFQTRDSLNHFSRNLINTLQKLCNAESLTLFLFRSDGSFQAILEKRNQVFVSGLHKKLTHSVETLIKHFRNGQYLISQSEPLIYLPLILEAKSDGAPSFDRENRLLGFLQLVTPPSMQRNSIQYLWMHIQKHVHILGEILSYEKVTTDSASRLNNSITFHKDCHHAWHWSHKYGQDLQLTLFQFKQWKQFLPPDATEPSCEQANVQKIAKTLSRKNGNGNGKDKGVPFSTAKNYRLTQDVFACIEDALPRADFEKKVLEISHELDAHASFSISSAISNEKFPSAKHWLQQVILGLS